MVNDMDAEKRAFGLMDVEVRAGDGEGAAPVIEGYAVVFGLPSDDLGGFVEYVERGAFAETLGAGPDVRATIEHNGGLMTLGRTTNGTLQLREDERGLRVEITLPETQAARDALALVRRGDVNQMSFMFRVVRDRWERREGDGYPLRFLEQLDLDHGDVSLVTWPAYPQTSAEARDRASALRQEASGGIDESDVDARRVQERLALRIRKIELMERD